MINENLDSHADETGRNFFAVKPIRPASALALAAAGLLSACTPRATPPPPAAATDTDPNSLGLRPPTAEERARMDAMAKKNPAMTANDLARERLNAERKAQGLPPLPAEPVPAPPKPASK